MAPIDLTRDSVAYYAHSSVEKSESFSKYIEDATSNEAMSDFCYESCKVAVDTFRSLLQVGDVCQGGVAAAAIKCLQQMKLCESSEFVNHHHLECATKTAKTTNATRTLGESEELWAESGEPVQLFVNETWLANGEAKSGRNLIWNLIPVVNAVVAVVDMLSPSPPPANTGGFDNYYNPQSVMNEVGIMEMTYECDEADFTWLGWASTQFPNTQCDSKANFGFALGPCTPCRNDCFCVEFKYSHGPGEPTFSFDLKFGNIEGRWGIYIGGTGCVGIELVFGLPPSPSNIAYCSLCLSGVLQVLDGLSCPFWPWTIECSLGVGFHFGFQCPKLARWGVSFEVWSFTLQLGSGITTLEETLVSGCTWGSKNDGMPSWENVWRRRRLMRRRYERTCANAVTICDIWVEAVTIFTYDYVIGDVTISTHFRYYFYTEKYKQWQDWVYTVPDLSGGTTYYESYIMADRDYTDLVPPEGSQDHMGTAIETCHWAEHWGKTTEVTMTEVRPIFKANGQRSKSKCNGANRDGPVIQGNQQCWRSGDYQEELIQYDTLHDAKRFAMRKCKNSDFEEDGWVQDFSHFCKAVVCWSILSVHEAGAADTQWACQMRGSPSLLEAHTYDFRVRTYTPEWCENYAGDDTLTVPSDDEQREIGDPHRDPDIKYNVPAFIASNVWKNNWGKTVSQKVWGPAGRRIWKKSTIQLASRLAMENCRYHNRVVTGSADGAVCKAVVCWSTKTEAQEPVASQWACQLRGSSNHVADWTTAYRVQTYTPDACQSCANNRWKQHWGKDSGHGWDLQSYETWQWSPLPVKYNGRQEADKIWEGLTINYASKQAKEACGRHNTGANKINLCKAIVCWSLESVHQGAASVWYCQMRSNSDLVTASTYDYRIRTYTPEACS